MVKIPRVHQPVTVEELATLLGARPSIQLLGGGTILIPTWLTQEPPDEVVYLPSVRDLRQCGENWCGAAVTLAALASKPYLPTALREAAASSGPPMIRNIATVGGNLAVGGCLAVALLVLDATVDRLESLPSAITTPRPLAGALASPEAPIITVRWHTSRGTQSAFRKFRPLGEPAIAVRWDGLATPESCAIAVGSIGMRPQRLVAAEEQWARLAYDDPIAAAVAAGQTAAREVDVVGKRGIDADYRRHLVSILVQRTLLEVACAKSGEE